MSNPISTKALRDESAGQAEGEHREQVQHPASFGPQSDILALQRTAGNRAVNRLLQSAPGSSSPASNGAPSIVHSVLNSSSGQPLDVATRAFMESRFDQDFSKVRIHTDTQAAESTQAVNAKAYTVGQDIVFRAGQYSPETPTGKRLLAHELMHTVQQQGQPRKATSGLIIGQYNNEYERSADMMAETVMQGKKMPRLPAKGVEAHIQRQVDDVHAAEVRSQAKTQEEISEKISQLVQMVLEELDRLLPSWKVLLQAFLVARKLGVLKQFALDLKARPYEKHGTYLNYFFKVLKRETDQKFFQHLLELLAGEGVVISELIEDYPLRFQIADYIDRKIDETMGILSGEPKDSLWWIIKGGCLETFYTLEKGFVDPIRIGQGSEEAAQAYAFEKDAVDRWAGVVRGLSEDFLRLTVVAGPIEKVGIEAFGKAAEKVGAESANKAIASELANKAEERIEAVANSVSRDAKTMAQKNAADIFEEATEDAAKKVSRELRSAEGATGKMKAATKRELKTSGETVPQTGAKTRPAQQKGKLKPATTKEAEAATTAESAKDSGLELDLGPQPKREVPLNEFELGVDTTKPSGLELDYGPQQTRKVPLREFEPEVDLTKPSGLSTVGTAKGREKLRRMRPLKTKPGEASGERAGTFERKGKYFHELNEAEIGPGQLRVDFDPEAGRPREVTFTVSKEALSGQAQVERSFKPDISVEGFQPISDAFTNSGYERGHLAPREAFKGTVGAEHAVDQTTNIVPMKKELNQGAWRRAEERTNMYAKEKGSIRVEATPIYELNPPRLSDDTPIPKTIRRRVMTTDGKVLEEGMYTNY